VTTQTQAGDGIVRPDTRVKLYWAKNDNLVLIGRHLHHVTRSPDQLFTAIMLPATLPLFRFVCGGAIDVGTTSLIGHLGAALFRAAISLVTMVGLGLAVGSAPPAPSSTRVLAAGALLLFAFSLAWVVAVLGLVARSADGAGGLGMILMFSPYASNAFVQPESLPDAGTAPAALRSPTSGHHSHGSNFG